MTNKEKDSFLLDMVRPYTDIYRKVYRALFESKNDLLVRRHRNAIRKVLFNTYARLFDETAAYKYIGMVEAEVQADYKESDRDLLLRITIMDSCELEEERTFIQFFEDYYKFGGFII